MRTLPDDGPSLLLEVLTGSPDYAIVLLDAEGHIEGWTGAAPSLFGYEADEALGQDFALIFVAEDVRLDLHHQEMALAAAHRRSEDDRWHLRKDGSRFWGSGVLQAVGDLTRGPLRYCKLVRDRSDVKTRTQALENEVERLHAELRRLNEFSIAVVHELRAPLAPITSATDVLEVTDDEASRTRARAVLRRQLGVLTRHIEDLYQASRASLGNITLQIETLVINDLIQAVVDDAIPSATAKGVDLRIVVPNQQIALEADPQRLQQMVQNLLGNAIKYTPAGGRVVVSATIEGRDVSIRVEDTGVGIEPAVLPRMFELFTREERGGAELRAEGLGVGLALVKTLADLHGGTVDGRSLGRDKGSVFNLRLPLRQPSSKR
jgi:two-component system CheB/CheR fusion protein